MGFVNLRPRCGHTVPRPLQVHDAAADAPAVGCSTMIQSPGFQSGSAIRTANLRLKAELGAAHAEISRLSAGSVLAGIADAPDVVTAFRDAHEERKRAIIDLLLTVTLLRGHQSGRNTDGTYFDPTTSGSNRSSNRTPQRVGRHTPTATSQAAGVRVTPAPQDDEQRAVRRIVELRTRRADLPCDRRHARQPKASSHANPNGGHP